MTVLNPSETTHVLDVIPRYLDITNTHTLTFHNEDRTLSSETDFNVTIDVRAISGGRIYYTFDLTVVEGDTYSYKIYDSKADRIVHRGKIFCTTQTPQNYTING